MGASIKGAVSNLVECWIWVDSTLPAFKCSIFDTCGDDYLDTSVKALFWDAGRKTLTSQKSVPAVLYLSAGY